MTRLFYRCAQIGILLVLIGIAGPATAQVARYVPLADGSGVQDTQTGLIWGYPLVGVDRFLTGGQTQRDWSFCLTMQVMTPDGHGGTTLIHYQDFSNTLFDRQDNDWRIPTKDEIVQALDAGLLLALDDSPAAGFQAFDPTNDWLWWSATSAGKVHGSNTAYAVDVLDDSVRATTVGSYLYGSVPVRGVAPPGTGKGGKGH